MTADLPAAAALREAGVGHEVVEFGPVDSLREAAARQNLAPGRVLKTMVVRRAADDYFFVLVPGDRVIDWKSLRDALGVTRLSLADEPDVEKVTGYRPGAITPLGSTHRWPVVADDALDTDTTVSIGSGRPGTSIHIDGRSLLAVLEATVGTVTKPGAGS